DQSQVQRYLSGKSVTESRLGLMMNGLLKVPMQYIILFIGVMVFVFYQFVQPPIFFNKVEKQKTEQSIYANELKAIETEYTVVFNEKKAEVNNLIAAVKSENDVNVEATQQRVLALQEETNNLREEAKTVIKKASPSAETNDKDYIFMTYVMDYLPIGMVGLLFAVMFSAAMSSTAS